MGDRYKKIDVTNDAFVVSSKQDPINGVVFIGKSQDSSISRAMFKANIRTSEDGEELVGAKFCYYQLYPTSQSRVKSADMITLHKINKAWNDEEVTWINTLSDSEFYGANQMTTKRSRPGRNCVPVQPTDFLDAQYGVLLKGNEEVLEEKSERAIYSSEWRVPENSEGKGHRPFWNLTYSNIINGDNNGLDSNDGSSSGGGSNTAVIAGLGSALGIAIVGVVAFFVIRRRNRYDDMSESESEESEVEKDFIDTVAEALGVVSSFLSETESEYTTEVGAVSSSESEGTGFEVQSKKY